ncbi:DUF4177 domain-containing protein [Maritimibacter sp. HL-12]|jgi:hypothetical protein|uniref:DUF4177 domain-containing protein n=1 Tax=Maritimibacter sp. HL-12 TaxID=1162418 RepID=UPI000A0F09D2|nr:DUF4177 domain-containing protein [Maritimibacter sp. HL-12]SMH31752.1 protein of unknown function [Maritimibacter sp. HL-12]
MTYEYKVVPAPTRGQKAKGLKTPADRFANALGAVINEMAAEGWEYQRTDTLPAEERHGLTGRSTVFQNMLIFRRVAEAESATDAETAAVLPAGTDDAGAAPQPPRLSASTDTPVARNGRTSLFAADRRGDVAAE